MHTTSISLLERLKQPGRPDAWDRFVELYTPLLYYWARRTGLPEHEAGDMVQDVFVVLLQKLPEFTYDGRGNFRGWLRTVTLNKWREGQRRRRPEPTELSDLAAPEESGTFEEVEYRRQLVGRALELMRAEFQPTTWKACWEYVVVGRPVPEVARELGVTVNAVYLAKSRVLRRLRQELGGLLD